MEPEDYQAIQERPLIERIAELEAEVERLTENVQYMEAKWRKAARREAQQWHTYPDPDLDEGDSFHAVYWDERSGRWQWCRPTLDAMNMQIELGRAVKYQRINLPEDE